MAAEALAAQAAVTAGSTDVTTLIAAIGASVTAVIAAAFPVMKLIDRWSATKTAAAKGDAESALYITFKEQLTQNSEAIAKLTAEKAELIQAQAELKARVVKLEELEKQNTQLKIKLDEKDSRITELVSEVMKKNNEITELRERIHQLEIRLAKDEREWCANCKIRQAYMQAQDD